MPVIFENPGIIDMRAVTTMGVNVKDDEGSAIGYFGTGLKFALAVLLRNGCKVEIRYAGPRDTKHYRFDTKTETIRGKDFHIVTMNGGPLGFTTNLGRNWELWMAYRELYCNAMDEGGRAYISNSSVPKPNTTHVIVHGEDFKEVHENRGRFILQTKPWLKYPGFVDVHQQRSQSVFYRGIAVHSEREGLLYAYDLNPSRQLRLTEDRILADRWKIVEAICNACKISDNREFIYTILTAPMGFMEHDFDFNGLFSGHEKPSETFIEVVLENQHKHDGFNRSAVKLVHSILGYEDHYGDIVEMTPRERKTLERAAEAIVPLGYRHHKYEIILVESLGEGTMGMTNRKSGKIILSRACFDHGTKYVASTLFEEFVHLYHGHGDCTRNMQNFLFEKLLSMVEEIRGEPI